MDGLLISIIICLVWEVENLALLSSLHLSSTNIEILVKSGRYSTESKDQIYLKFYGFYLLQKICTVSISMEGKKDIQQHT